MTAETAETAVPGLPRSADIIVVGGGAMGVSTAYHLAAAGAGSVLLLEREDAEAKACSNAPNTISLFTFFSLANASTNSKISRLILENLRPFLAVTD